MIISHKYRFIFVKTRKTAGSSIEVYLSDPCGEADVLTPLNPSEAGHRPRNYRGLFNPLPELLSNRGKSARESFGQVRRRLRFVEHLEAYRIRGRVPANIWKSYFKFAVERNPFDWVISLSSYFSAFNGGSTPIDQILVGAGPRKNSEFYSDPVTGEVMVDKILRFEHLDEDLTSLFDMLGVPFSGKLQVQAKSGYRRNREHYSQILTRHQRERIEILFARELELWGYDFHQGPFRPTGGASSPGR